jgi:hypothetical protein
LVAAKNETEEAPLFSPDLARVIKLASAPSVI